MFATGKNAWLDMKDTGKHAWWEHGKTPGHKALEGNLVNSFLHTTMAVLGARAGITCDCHRLQQVVAK